MFDNLSSVDEVYWFKDVISVCEDDINPKSVICCEPLIVPLGISVCEPDVNPNAVICAEPLIVPAGTEPPPLPLKAYLVSKDEVSWDEPLIIPSGNCSEPLMIPPGNCCDELIIPLPIVS